MEYFLGERLYSKQLNNGLKIFVLPKKSYNEIFAIYSTRYGSIDSEFIVPDTREHLKVPEGIAHFLEHKMFEMEYGNVFDKFAELGTSVNAFTDHTNTSYLFSATSFFRESLELLLEFVETPYFTHESVEKEKGIITQELRMYQDEPEWQVLLNLLNCLYHHHPVKIDLGGTVDSIQKIDKDILYKCYNTFYHPSNMVLFVTGAVEPENVFDIVEQHEMKKEIKPQADIKRIYPEEPTTINRPSSIVYLDVAQPMFLMGFKEKDVGYDGFDLLKRETTVSLLMEIMFGRSSLLYEKIYEDGLINDKFSFSYEGQKDYGFCTIGGETKDPERLYNKIIESIEHYKQIGIDPKDFERVKKKYDGDFIQGFNSVEFIATNFVAYHHKNIHLFDYIKALQQITLGDINKKLKDLFDPSMCATSKVMPKIR
jgi:predicted Zn-dependent peptidase